MVNKAELMADISSYIFNCTSRVMAEDEYYHLISLCEPYYREIAKEAYKSERLKSKTHVNMQSEDERVIMALNAMGSR